MSLNIFVSAAHTDVTNNTKLECFRGFALRREGETRVWRKPGEKVCNETEAEWTQITAHLWNDRCECVSLCPSVCVCVCYRPENLENPQQSFWKCSGSKTGKEEWFASAFLCLGSAWTEGTALMAAMMEEYSGGSKPSNTSGRIFNLWDPGQLTVTAMLG